MLRLLVVEDFPPLAKVMVRVLGQAGFEVVRATSRAEARTSEGWFDAAIVDLELPDATGIEVAGDLRAGGQVELIVFFTACRDSALLSIAAEMGKVIAKDAGVATLLTMVKQWLTEGHRRRLAVGEASAISSPPGRVPSQRSGTRRIRR
jgi:DNA-binding response OmpR family regulator